MNFSSDAMSSAMSPYLSGTSSPVPGSSNYPSKQGNNGAYANQMPSAMALAAAAASTSRPQDFSSPALAYANAQLSQYAQHQSPGQQPRQPVTTLPTSNQMPGTYASFFSQGTAIPPHLNPHALSAALADYTSNSVPNSAASSPGQQYKRLANSNSLSGLASGTATGASTPGGNSRVAASAITGKRLNWSEMICQTIAESESGRLVIQDLFEGMCNKFPEIREWAFGKDWEGRVKNRIKSTLSIKGNLFIKVPRPSSASGKGSWWTLSQEAQDAWKEGRVASVVKSGTHSRSMSQTRALDGMTPLSTSTSRAGSRAPSRRGSPVSSRGPSSHHANQHAHTNSRGTPHQGYVNFGQDNYTSSSPGASHANQNNNNNNQGSRQSPSSSFPVGLGMSPINFGGNSFEALSMSSLTGMDDVDEHNSEPSERRMRMMENSVNDSFDSTQMHSGSDGSSQRSVPANLAMNSMQGSNSSNATSIYDMSPYNSFSASAAAQHLGPLQSASHLGGPQSMPFPPGSNNMNAPGNMTSMQGNYPKQSYNPQGSNNTGDANKGAFDPSAFLGDPAFAQFAGIDLSNMEGMNNPFGSMAGGYTMLTDAGNNSNMSAQPTPIPGRNNTQQQMGGNGGNGANQQLSGSNSSFSANFIGGPSPADSTGSTSAFFAYTPAMMAADAAMGSTGNQVSALGPVGGEGSRKKKEAMSDFQLPPSAQSSSGSDAKNKK